MKLLKPLASLALVAAFSGCADNHSTIEIFGICAPPADASSCASDGTCSALLASPRPFVYLQYTSFAGAAVDNELVMFMEFRNQRPRNEDRSSGRVNTADAKIEKYKYKFGGVAVPELESPATGTVPAGGSSTPVVPIIPGSAALLMQGLLPAGLSLVTVELRAAGRYDDGSTFETGAYQVAVDVYNSTFPGYGCPKLGDIVSAVCPNPGQTSTWTCSTP